MLNKPPSWDNGDIPRSGVPLLLADPSPFLRLLVMKDLLYRPDSDAEVRELSKLLAGDRLVSDLRSLQSADGSWSSVPGLGSRGSLHTTSLVLSRLGYIGLDPSDRMIQLGAEHLFAMQEEDGSWPLYHGDTDGSSGDRYDMIPLQTAFPLRALSLCGYAEDDRCERAYEWLLDQRLPEGVWPTGISSGSYGGVAGYRRIAHSRLGCRSNTTAALLCFARHPRRRTESYTRKTLDHLLGRETREQGAVGWEVAKLIGAEPSSGFLTYFARFDTAVILDLCWRIGADADDPRIRDSISFIVSLQNRFGLWIYRDKPQVSRWLSFDLLRSLSRISSSTDWISREPRTPFRAYDPLFRRH